MTDPGLGVGSLLRELTRTLHGSETLEIDDLRIMGTSGDGFIDALGIRLTRVGRGTAWATMRITRGHLNQQGTVQGGALIGLADATAGWATFGLIDPPRTFSTIELNANLIRTVQPDVTLLAVASTLHIGRSTSVVDVRVEQQSEGGPARPVAQFRCTQMFLDGS